MTAARRASRRPRGSSRTSNLGVRLAAGVPTTDEIVLRVTGSPTGKGRPRFDGRPIERADGTVQRGRSFTPEQTVRAENRVQLAWMAAGRPQLPDGPIVVRIEAVVARPKGHWRKDGTLGAAGIRAAWPTGKPDLDNVLKLVGDALNQHAYRDDAAIVDARIVRRWAHPRELEHMVVRLAPAPVPSWDFAA